MLMRTTRALELSVKKWSSCTKKTLYIYIYIYSEGRLKKIIFGSSHNMWVHLFVEKDFKQGSPTMFVSFICLDKKESEKVK